MYLAAIEPDYSLRKSKTEPNEQHVQHVNDLQLVLCDKCINLTLSNRLKTKLVVFNVALHCVTATLNKQKRQRGKPSRGF